LSEGTLQRLVQAFLRFRAILNQKAVLRVRAVATSAMREAANREEAVARIRDAAGIEVSVIDGKEEARLISQAVMDVVNCAERVALLVDIGGGSVEVTVLVDGEPQGTECLPLGTVRLLQQMKQQGLTARDMDRLTAKPLSRLRQVLHKAVRARPIDLCVGTGGNIEALGGLREGLLRKKGKRLVTAKELGRLVEAIERSSLQERLSKWALRPDRADVIVPAAYVLQAIVKQAGVPHVAIPCVGLKEGLLLDLVEMIFKRNLLEPDHRLDQLPAAGPRETYVKRLKRASVLVGRFSQRSARRS
jgi:exopolyphosphatase/guanosine-5'-triphosphate,3'-diphosphate pyrophosphatase